jgi:hypothetical protein
MLTVSGTTTASETSSVAAWLQEHPGAGIVCRDRLMVCTKAPRQTAPTPWQWLIAGISSKVCRRCGEDVPSAPCMPAPTDAGPPPAAPVPPLFDRVRQCHRDVNELAAMGAVPPRRQLPPSIGPQDGTALSTQRPPPERTPSGRAAAVRLTQDELTGTSPVLSATPIPRSALLVVPR